MQNGTQICHAPLAHPEKPGHALVMQHDIKRYDLDTSDFESLDLKTMMLLLTLAGKWQYRNHQERVWRLEREARGPETLK
jgi:hypothetical protein